MNQPDLFDQSLEGINEWLKTKPKAFKTYEDLYLEAELVKDLPVEFQNTIKDGTLSKIERERVQQLVSTMFEYVDSPDQIGAKTKILVDSAIKTSGVKGLRKCEALRAELVRQMFNLCGASTGYYKSDYAIFMTAKEDSYIGKALEAMEEEINRLSRFIKECEG